MTFALSTHLFVRNRLTTLGLERVWDAGFTAVEIFCARQHFDYRNRAQVDELAHWFRDSPLTLHSIHNPMYNDDVWGRSGPQAVVDITEPSKGKRILAVDEIKRAMEIAEILPFRYAIQHLGVSGQEYDERRIESAFSSLEELKVFAGQCGVDILLENTPNALSSAAALNRFLNETHLNLRYCFDIGHAHMASGVADEWALMKDRVRSTHIHDNDGKEDAHLRPGQGSIDWEDALRLLLRKSDQYPLLFELREPAEGLRNPVEEGQKALEFINEIKIDG
jgi:sugar phosphate isomerase/epimerase